ncbi:MAG: alpha/beta hydrolase, partial [Shewanella sp.]
DHYIGQRYEMRPTPWEVSAQVQGVVAGILGDHGAREIAQHPNIHTHIVACRARHLNRCSHKAALVAGLALTAATNLVGRQSVAWHFERVVFSQRVPTSPFMHLSDLPTVQAPLTAANAPKVLLATGSIPMLLAPVSEIAGAANGQYYDGGITDYHFDLPLSHAPGLTLYPHFYPHISPGWFDKALPWRRARAHYHNALVLAPRAEFVSSLPWGKLPDRQDFELLDTAQRIKSWRAALGLSERLADDFAEVFAKGNLMEHIERL